MSNSAAVEASSRKVRSRVSNGTALFNVDDVDGRSAAARRYRDIVSDLASHLGKEPTAAEELITRRIASIAVWCEAAEAGMVGGKGFDIAEFTTATNALRRLLADIGLERRARDVTPSLEVYLATKASKGEAA